MKKIRADYQEFIELTALLLGVETLNGSQIKIKSPGKKQHKDNYLNYIFNLHYFFRRHA